MLQESFRLRDFRLIEFLDDPLPPPCIRYLSFPHRPGPFPNFSTLSKWGQDRLWPVVWGSAPGSLNYIVFYRMANFDIRQNSNIRYRRIATILPEYQLFHQNTQFPTRIHNSLPEYQNKLPEYQNKMDSFTILRITVFCILPLILQSDPSYQMLTWSLSLKHWFQKLTVLCSTLWCLFCSPWYLFCSPWCTMHSSLKLMPYHLPYQVRHQCQKHHENSWSLTPSLNLKIFNFVHLQETCKFKLLNSNNSNQFCIHLLSSHQ